MPIRPQPQGARGTVGHPFSALNLRAVLAGCGFATFAMAAALFLRAGLVAAGVCFAVLAVLALVNLVVVHMRRRARRRAGEIHKSLFE